MFFLKPKDVSVGITCPPLAIRIPVGPRAGSIGFSRCSVALVVVCHGKKYLATGGVPCSPFRAIHWRGAHGVGREPREDKDFCLALKAEGLLRLNGWVIDLQRQPLSSAIGQEAGSIEATVVEVAVS